MFVIVNIHNVICLILYVFRTVVLHTQVYSQLIGKLVLMLVNISVASSSNHRGKHVQHATYYVKYKW